MKVVEDFEEAVRDHAFKGASHPEDVPYIEERYLHTKERLINALKKAKATNDPNSRFGMGIRGVR